jgi:hypothetical protein
MHISLPPLVRIVYYDFLPVAVPTTVSTISNPLKLGYRFAKLLSQSSAAPSGGFPLLEPVRSPSLLRADDAGLLGVAVLPPVLSLVGFGGGGGLVVVCVTIGVGVGTLPDLTGFRTIFWVIPDVTGLAVSIRWAARGGSVAVFGRKLVLLWVIL